MKTKKSFETDTRATIQEYLPIEGINSGIDYEIAKRILANASLVHNRRELYDQILIVLADYHDHAWTGKAFKGEADRIRIANRILARA